MKHNTKSIFSKQEKPKKQVNKDEVLTGQEIADLFESIITETGNDMLYVNGLLALLHTIRQYVNSDYPHMIDDLCFEPSKMVFQYTLHYDRAVDDILQRGAKIFKTTDYRDKEDRKAKLDADLEDYESRLDIDRTEEKQEFEKQIEDSNLKRQIDSIESFKRSLRRKKGESKKDTEVC